ncbi:minor capsid protein [Capybara microvirus Cap1_SP_127]|nr:minor capsid protein [Capybara microvirus Cap1_SP_127]
MEPATTSALITAGAGLSSGILNLGATNKLNKKSVNYNKQLIDYNYEKQKAYNDYIYSQNSVKNQIQQYIDAGLNPNLAYGNSSPSQMSPIKSDYTPANLQTPNFDFVSNSTNNAFQSYNNFRQIQSDLDTADANRLNLIEQNGILKLNKIAAGLGNKKLSTELLTYGNLQRYQLESQFLQNQIARQSFDKTAVTLPLEIQLLQQNVQHIINENKLKGEELHQMQKYGRRLKDYEIQTAKYNIEHFLPSQLKNLEEKTNTEGLSNPVLRAAFYRSGKSNFKDFYDDYINQKSRSAWDESLLGQLEKWIDSKISPKNKQSF